jgi:hypothetical protein
VFSGVAGGGETGVGIVIYFSFEDIIRKKEFFMSDESHNITLELTEEEQVLLEMLTREGGFDAPADALRSLLHEAIAVYDAIWDKAFAESEDLLERLADEAHAEYLAGETEDFDPDSDDRQ